MPEQFDPYHVWLGIPPEEQPPNHYRLLGLRPFEANADVISNAVDQRRVFLRSVQAGKRGAQSQQLLNEVSAAGVLLLDAAKKALYDAELRKRLSPRPAGVVHPAAAGLPDPMAPLALPGVLPQQPTAAGPLAREASPTTTSPQPSRAPVILSSPATRRSGKGPSSSATTITAVVLSGAALLLILILGGVWWSMSRTKAPESVVATATAPTSPPGLPPSLPPLGPSVGEPTSTASKNTSVVHPSASSNRSAPPLPSGAAVAPPASQQRLALVFNGNESVQIPLPEEIAKSGGEFTWEMWAKWDSYEPVGVLLDCGHMRIESRAWENQSEPAFNAVHVSSSGGGNGSPGVKRGEWVHIAVVSRQDSLVWFMHGLERGMLSVEPSAKLASTALLGGASNAAGINKGFHGLVRDFRISRGRRYAGNFTPEEKFSQDERTLVLLKLDGSQPTNGQVRNLVAGSPAATVRSTHFIPLADNGEVAGELPDGTVDLLRIVNVSTGTLEGENYQTGSYVETRALLGRSRILVPYRPPAEYDVELDLTREEGAGGAFLGLEIAGRPAIVSIGAYPQFGRRTGLLPRQLGGNLGDVKVAPYLSLSSRLLPLGERQKIFVQVRLNGTQFRIDVHQGPAAVTRLQGGEAIALECPPEFTISKAHGMSLGSIDAKIRIDRAILRPVTREYSPELVAIMRQSPIGPAGDPKTAQRTPSPVSSIGSRQPVPDSDSLTKAEERARKLYANDLKMATRPQQQMALGNVILSAGRATQNDPTDRFVLVDLSRTLFIQAGDVLEALTAARLLEIEYDIPRDQLLTTTIEALENEPVIPEHRLMLTRTAAELADSATDAQDFERAEKLATIAVQSAGKMRDSELRKDLVERRNYIQRLMKEWDTVKVSLEKLKSNRDDAAANLEVGKFYCFSLEDFYQGLPYLAACGESALAEAAKLDLAAAERADSRKRLEAAQAWQKAQLKILEREDKLAVQRREKWLLQQAIAGLTGVEQIEASRRLVQLQNVGPPTGRKMGVVPASPTKTKKKKA